MPTIFDGVDEIIDRSLGVQNIGHSPHHRHKTTALRLMWKPNSFDCNLLVSNIQARITSNWEAQRKTGVTRLGSAQNWRWEKKTYISEQNTSQEKLIEKSIAVDCDDCWANQTPTASGLMTSTNERHCNIDLIHRVGDGEFEFIELKFNTDTPVFAAFEILKYGLLYVFSRQHISDLGYGPEKALLKANAVTLCVLAPYDFYRPYTLEWLESALNSSLGQLGSRCSIGLSFRFEYFRWPVENAAELVASRRKVHGHAVCA